MVSETIRAIPQINRGEIPAALVKILDAMKEDIELLAGLRDPQYIVNYVISGGSSVTGGTPPASGVGTGDVVRLSGDVTGVGVFDAFGDVEVETTVDFPTPIWIEDVGGNIYAGTLAADNILEGSADHNFLVGELAGNALTSGDHNIAIGNTAFDIATSQRFNIALGFAALSGLNSGTNTNNIAIGASALTAITSGVGNVAVGVNALIAMVTSSGNNVGIGANAGQYATGLSSGNVFLGYHTGPLNLNPRVVTDELFIHNTHSDAPLIHGDFSTGVVTINGTLDVTGTGHVTKVGTPVDNEIGVWTGDGTLEGDANLTWDGAILSALALTSETGDVIIATAGKGIDFSANTGATGEVSALLDWYEEGTWTPVLSDGTNDATMDIQDAYYQRIGNTVYIQFRMSTSALGSVSGSLRITGFPFTVKSGNSVFGVACTYATGLDITAGNNLAGFMQQNTTFMHLRIWDVITGTGAPLETEWTADGAVMMTGCYRV